MNKISVIVSFILISIGCTEKNKCDVELMGFKNVQPYEFADSVLEGTYMITTESLYDLSNSITKDISQDSIFISMLDNKLFVSNRFKKLRYEKIFKDISLSDSLHGRWEQTTNNKEEVASISISYLKGDDNISFIESFQLLSTDTNYPVLAVPSFSASDKYCGLIFLLKNK